MNRYRIELLQTAEGINYKKDKTKDIVVVFLWAENPKKAREEARKIANALAVDTYIGVLEYIIKNVKLCNGPAV